MGSSWRFVKLEPIWRDDSSWDNLILSMPLNSWYSLFATKLLAPLLEGPVTWAALKVDFQGLEGEVTEQALKPHLRKGNEGAYVARMREGVLLFLEKNGMEWGLQSSRGSPQGQSGEKLSEKWKLAQGEEDEEEDGGEEICLKWDCGKKEKERQRERKQRKKMII
ncbi:hypothetical protein CDL15_Pgr023478 [Punica granatum]|uniref:Uncharacterized protein n=1 Tax=Punica granatum TaxID=22663 RepID=A0A218W7K0_PUNGR|nr:hypothetical protein CDL15_Pgr023478 [Punica granatum]PKI59592.1 hypothetical protein CRG98_020001 [Punica granatum]